MSVEVREADGGIVVPVHAQPGARRQGVVGIHGGRLKTAVRQKAEKGRANREIERVLAEFFGVPVAQARIVAGESSSQKLVRLDGVTRAYVLRRIDELEPGT